VPRLHPTRLPQQITLNTLAFGGVWMYEGSNKRMSSYVQALTSKPEVTGCGSEFADRVAESQRRIFQIAYSVLANPADAEEVAQEVFLKAYRKSHVLRDVEKFRAWVSRMAFRLALNRQRARRRQLARDTAWYASNPDPILDGARSAEQQVSLNRLRNEIDNLPEKLRAVLLLSVVEDMDSSEVASILKIPVGTVRSRLHVARKRLLGALHR